MESKSVVLGHLGLAVDDAKGSVSPLGTLAPMGTARSDLGWDDHQSDRAAAELDVAEVAAKEIAAAFTAERSDSSLHPDVSVVLDVGGDDEPLFVFSMDVDLDEGLDVDEYPLDEVQELASELRSRIAASVIATWSSLVTVATKASAAS